MQQINKQQTTPYRTALALAALGLTATAHAQTIQYGDRASFNAAASGLTTFTFDGDAPKNGQKSYPAGLTVQGAGFAAVGGDGLYAVDPAAGNGNPFGGHQFLDVFSGNTPGMITVSLPAGTTAFGADFANFDSSSGATLTATVNGTAFTFQAPSTSAPAPAFAGFTSSVPITSLSFSGGLGVALDTVSFGKAAPPAPAVPEPSAPASLGVGILGLAGLVLAARRRRTKEKAAA